MRQFDLQRPIVRLGDSNEWLRWVDLCEGTWISGGTGSGKSSTAGAQIFESVIRAGGGALALCTKEGEADERIEIVRRAGRLNDLVVMRKGGSVKNNLIATAYKQGGIEDVVQVIGVAGAAVSGARVDSGKFDPTWKMSGDDMTRNAGDMLSGAGEELSLQNFANLVASAPTNLKDAEALLHLEERLLSKSIRRAGLTYFERVWLKLGLRYRSGELGLDANTIHATQLYWLKQYPGLPERTAGSVRFSLENSIGALTRGAIADLCTKETTFDFSALREGNILILDLPPKTHGESGRAIQTMVKHLVQKQLERDNFGPASNGRPVMIFVDEAHGFVTEADIEFQATARSARAPTVLISQSIAGYRRKLGADATTALLEVMNTKIMFCPGEIESANWASELISEDWDFEPSFSSGGSFTWSEQKRRVVEPIEFMRLARGGRDFDYRAESFVFKPGARFGKDGRNFLKVTWTQRRGR